MKKMKATFVFIAMAALPVLSAQSLPDGPGKDLVNNQCGSCHGLEQVVAHGDTKDGWNAVVDYMVSRGMAATNDEVKVIVEYLAKNFPPPAKPPAAPAK